LESAFLTLCLHCSGRHPALVPPRLAPPPPPPGVPAVRTTGPSPPVARVMSYEGSKNHLAYHDDPPARRQRSYSRPRAPIPDLRLESTFLRSAGPYLRDGQVHWLGVTWVVMRDTVLSPLLWYVPLLDSDSLPPGPCVLLHVLQEAWELTRMAGARHLHSRSRYGQLLSGPSETRRVQ
jgi:hypothetical protein